jgi:hypothetical protein
MDIGKAIFLGFALVAATLLFVLRYDMTADGHVRFNRLTGQAERCGWRGQEQMFDCR